MWKRSELRTNDALGMGLEKVLRLVSNEPEVTTTLEKRASAEIM